MSFFYTDTNGDAATATAIAALLLQVHARMDRGGGDGGSGACGGCEHLTKTLSWHQVPLAWLRMGTHWWDLKVNGGNGVHFSLSLPSW